MNGTESLLWLAEDWEERKRNLGYLHRFGDLYVVQGKPDEAFFSLAAFHRQEAHRLRKKRSEMERLRLERAPYSLLGNDDMFWDLDAYERLILDRILGWLERMEETNP